VLVLKERRVASMYLDPVSGDIGPLGPAPELLGEAGPSEGPLDLSFLSRKFVQGHRRPRMVFGVA